MARYEYLIARVSDMTKWSLEGGTNVRPAPGATAVSVLSQLSAEGWEYLGQSEVAVASHQPTGTYGLGPGVTIGWQRMTFTLRRPSQ